MHGHHDIRTVRLALAVVLLAMGGVFTPSCVRADAPDDSTPRRALHHFVDSARAGDYERHGPGWIAEALPAVLVETRILEVEAWQWLGIALGAALASLVALLAAALARALSRRLARTARVAWDGGLVETMVGPARLLLGLGAFPFALEYLRLPAPAEGVATHLVRTAVILAVTWAGLRSVGFLADLASERLRKREGGAARTIATRIMVLRRVAGIAVAVVGGSLVLLQFEGLRTIGTSLLASAGVAGLVVGVAAQAG